MGDAVEAEKRRIRARVRARRAERGPAERAACAQAFDSHLVALTDAHAATSLTAYLAVPGEPDPEIFVARAREAGRTVLMPAAREDGLLDWIEMGDDGLANGAFGIREPLGEALSPLTAASVGLMIIPACAVDARGGRLGWGGGYFDRWLGALRERPPVFALVHADEVLAEVPREPHDIPIDGFVTPDGVRRAKRE